MAPGASPGTLTINGDYTQGAGGTLRAEIAGTARCTTSWTSAAPRRSTARSSSSPRRASTRRPRTRFRVLDAGDAHRHVRDRLRHAGHAAEALPRRLRRDRRHARDRPRAGQHRRAPSIPASGEPGDTDHAATRERGRARPRSPTPGCATGADRDRPDVHARRRGRRPEHRVPRDGDQRERQRARPTRTRSRPPRPRRRPPRPRRDAHADRRRRPRSRRQGRAAATADHRQDGQRGGRARHGDRSSSPTAGRSRSTTRRRSSPAR